MTEQIESREAHIIDLARIVAAKQGEAKPGAPVAKIDGNSTKISVFFICDRCGDQFDEGDAQWNVILADKWAGECRHCLPGKIERGEVILDRRSAHSTLAYMLGGSSGKTAYHEYFVADPMERVS